MTRRYTRDHPSLDVKRSRIHGRGLFSVGRIEGGALIGGYAGEPTERNGAYVLWVESETGDYVGINGRNELRYLNHCSVPNAVFEGIHLYAATSIDKDEEITFDYGEEWA